MEVPEDFRHRYKERRKKDLEICMAGLALNRFDDLARVGHQLKGNAETFGFRDLSHIGKNIEKAAKSEDLRELKKALNDFSSWVGRELN